MAANRGSGVFFSKTYRKGVVQLQLAEDVFTPLRSSLQCF